MIGNTEDKKITVANFNIVFKDDQTEFPLLDYFDSIVMPALTSGIIRKQDNNTYLLMDVGVSQDSCGEYVLTGLIVKDTIIEIKSVRDEKGSLIPTNESYPSSPFSTFVIYLKNHRMILVENQKGSPSLKSFQSTIRYMINTYVERENLEHIKNGNKLLPSPVISIVGIPPKGSISDVLKDVEKVSLLRLRFYPLNGDGDVDLSGVMTGISKTLRRQLGCDRGEIMYRSPKNLPAMIQIIEQTEGTVEPIIVAKYPNKKGEVTIRYNEISDRRKIRLSEEGRSQNLENMIEYGRNIDSIKYLSEENLNIYCRNENKIIPFVRKPK